MSPDVGGNLPKYLGYSQTQDLINYVDDVYLKFGADKKIFGIDKEDEIREIRRKAISGNLKLVECLLDIWVPKKDTIYIAELKNT